MSGPAVRILPLAAALVLAVAATGTDDPPADSCCAEEDAPLPPLPADATPTERALRRFHDERDLHPDDAFRSARYVDAMRERLRSLPADAPLSDRFGVRWSLANFCVQTGAIEEAIALLEECVALIDAASAPGAAPPPGAATSPTAWLPDTLFRLASAQFRLAERQNCIARHNAESCIFPLSERAVHVETSGPRGAIAVLERLLALLDAAPPEQRGQRHEARWLLNVAHMALGTWPDDVPAAHVIAKERFAPEATLPRFVDRAAELGLARHSRAGSIVVDDFTGDGRLDVVTCSVDTGAPLRLSRNDGDGGFTDATAEAGLAHQLGGVHLIHGDADGDGRLDLFVARGGGTFAGERLPSSLLLQDRPGHFVEAPAESGAAHDFPTRAGAFADVDLDGDLDLFLGCETVVDAAGYATFPSRLLVNGGAATFRDATEASRIANPARCAGAVFGDVDGDGDPDLFVSNFLAPNRLFVNDGAAVFAEAAAARGVAGPLASGPAGFFDQDDDGDLDLLVGYAHHYQTIRAVAAWYAEGSVADDTMRLFVNDGAGTFRDATAERGLRRVAIAAGLGFGDADNDGRQDVYVATGGHDMAALFPNVLLLNGDRFRDATFAAGVGHLQKGNGVAFADIDDDGDVDLGVQVGGWYLDDGFGDVFFENPGSGGHWLAVDLEGTRDNRFGVGARVTVRVATEGGERDVVRFVGAGGSLGAGPLRAHFGLGAAQRIVHVEVAWPAAGETQTVTGVPLDAAIRVVQDVHGFTLLDRPPSSLGARRGARGGE